MIASYVRTPITSFLSGLASVPVTKLGSVVIKEAIEKAGKKKKATPFFLIYENHFLL